MFGGTIAPGDTGAAGLNRRDRTVILLALCGVTAIAWVYLATVSRDMAEMAGDMADMAMPLTDSSTASVFALTFTMWWVMMLGMMVPSAAPMILTFATLNRNRRAKGETFVPASVFLLGYLVAWGAFSAVATAAQWALDGFVLLTPMLAIGSWVFGGLLLIAAGLYQFSPLKQACLRACRSPFAFALNHWRDGRTGALRMGLEHGAYCIGCCAVLMALLFLAGAMNLLWVAALAVFVFAEKLLPGGVWVGRAGGIAMLAFGLVLVARGFG
jgi:predicted metal-binding membrane protein